MIASLIKVRDALTSIDGLSVYHYWRPNMSAPFCVWAEYGESSSLQANNHKREQAIGGYVDYFTLNEFDETVDSIQVVLNSVEGLGWSLESVQYEDETNLIHYQWRFDCIGEVGL